MFDALGSTSPIRVVQERGGTFEAEHLVSAALVFLTGGASAGAAAAGECGQVIRWGEPLTTTWRSAAKPFQLAGSLQLIGAATPDRMNSITAEQLAIGAASHSAEPGHLELVQSVLTHFDLSEAVLRCGAHMPVAEAAAEALLRDRENARALHNNCSGKHAFMAAAARASGSPLQYRDPAHPLQAAIRHLVATACGRDREDVGMTPAIDGCGAPCFALELAEMARAWATLARAFVSPTPLGRIARAMQAHPWTMSGTDRLDLRLVTSARRPIVSKVGAAGLLCVALPHLGAGLALKVHSGDATARVLAAQVLLEHIAPGLLPAQPLPESVVTNVIGLPVGRRRISGVGPKG